MRDILAKPERVLEIIKTDLQDIKERYPTPRKTEMSYDLSEIDIADLVKQEDVVISMTHLGYIKRISLEEYHSQRRGGKGVTAHKPKDEDFVENMFVSSTHDRLLFFTNFGKVYRLMGYEIPEAQKTARGRAVVNLLQLSAGERVSAVIPLNASENIADMGDEFAETQESEVATTANDTASQNNETVADGETACETAENGDNAYIVLATKRGLIKKTAVSEFDNIRKTGKIAINLNEGDELISVQVSSGHDEILVASLEGKCIRFSETDVRAMGRDTQGVRAMLISEDDAIVDMTVVKEGFDVLTISSHGFGKRSDISDYRLQTRGGKGIKAGVFNEKTGHLVSLKLVADTEDIMIIADNGIIIRTSANGISKIGRDTKGVTIMKLGESSVATVAVVPHEEERPEDDGEEVAVDAQIEGEEVAVESAETVEVSEETETTETTETTSDSDEE